MERKTKSNLLLILAAIITAIIIGGYYYKQYEEKLVRDSSYIELKSIAELKTNEIQRWLDLQRYNAETISGNAMFKNYIQNWIFNQSDASAHKKLSEIEKLVTYPRDFEDVILVSPSGKVLISSEQRNSALDEYTEKCIQEALDKRKTIVCDLYNCSIHNSIHLDIISPVISKQNEIIALIVCRIDPHRILFPLIQTWPTESKSAEALLIETRADSVIFLNKLRHVKNEPAKMKMPINNKFLPAARAALGQTGLFEGLDYRGVKVLADLHHIEGTSWSMVCKVDQDEIYSEMDYRIQVIYLVVLMLIIISALLIFLYYRSQQKLHYQELFSKQKELSEALHIFRTTLYSIGDAVITTDLDGKVAQMNPAAEDLTGWTELDAKGKPIGKVFKLISEDDRSYIESPVKRVLNEGLVVGLANHTLLISKSGIEIPIADSGAPIKNDAGEIIGVVLVFRDQTDERKAQNEVRENANRFRSLFNNMAEGVALHELIFDEGNNPIDYKIVDANSSYERILNIAKQPLLGKPATKVYGVKEAPYLEQYSKVAMSGLPYSFQTYFPPMDKYFDISVAPWINNGFVTIFTDITERIKNEQALRLREEKLTVTLNSIGDGVILTDLKGFVTHLNPVAETLTGWKLDDALYRPLTEVFKIINAETRLTVASPVERVIKEGIIIGLANHTALIGKDGTERQIADSAAPIKDSDGSILGVVLVFSDVTSDYELQSILRENERLLRESQNAANIGSYTLDIKTGIWKSSEALDKIFGLTPDYIRSIEGWVGIIHPLWQKKMADYFQNEVIAKRARFDIEYMITRQNDGTERWVHGLGELELDKENNPVRMMGTIQDVTESVIARHELDVYRNNLEEQVKERTIELDNLNARLVEEIQKEREFEMLLKDSLAKEKELNDLKTNFISTVSHEFRTPLMSIQLSTELMERNRKYLDEEKFSDHIRRIKNSIKNLTRLMDEVLVINKAETGKLFFEPKPVDLPKFIEETIQELEVYSDDGHRLLYNYKPDKREFMLDPKLLKYILSNLLTNAYKYSPDGGDIRFEITTLANELHIKIEDNGIGINEEDSLHLFEPFFRSKNAIDFPGSGLGLSIVKKSVELHKGKISCSSKLNEGTKFEIKLPIVPPADSN